MNLAMNARIVFPARDGREAIEIKKVSGVEIETGWEILTDTATIVLPRNVKFFDKQKVKETFKAGDKVIIELGYDGELIKEFEGYIVQVSADIPIKIKCEDAMYLLKRHAVNISLQNTTLKTLLENTLPQGFKFDALDVEIGSIKYSNTTVTQMLEVLKDDYNLYGYIKNFDTLVVGKIYQDDTDEPVYKFDFARNVVNNNLEYKTKEEVLIRVKAVSTLPKGKKLIVEVGDADGVMKQLTYYNIRVKAELEKLAKKDYDKFKIDGFDGTLEAFGIPSVKHGQKAELISGNPNAEFLIPGQYPERNGTYWIKKIVKTFDDSPKYHQVITLDRKVE